MQTIYYGTGKGKSSAAIGQALLAAAEGKTVAVVQFLKDGREAKSFALPTLHWFSLGRKFDFFRMLPQQVQEEVTSTHHQILQEAVQMVQEGGCLVLDEVLHALSFGLLEEEVLQQALAKLPPEVEIVYTGKTPPLWLLDQADAVTRFLQEKQPKQPENLDAIPIEL